MDAKGLDQEQQALLASIMGKSPQAGGGAAFSAAKVTDTLTETTTAAPADSRLNQRPPQTIKEDI